MTMSIPRRGVLVLAALAFTALVQAADISGAGATFPYPIYAKWADAYKKQTGVGLNYQSIGSGGGIKQIKAKTVTFGASDMPLKPAELQAAGLVQFPMIIGGVVPVVNIKGLSAGALTLDGPTLAGIYLGEIAKWNDSRISRLNPNITLPALAIAPIYRSDGSGTNFLFTDFLSKVSPKFKQSIGANTSVQWPVGIGAKGNEGIANMVAQTSGAIGYVEFAYARQNRLIYVRMKNHDGKIVVPEASAFQAAAASADWAKADSFYLILTNQPGERSWPITGASFILMHRDVQDKQAAAAALKFFAWAFADGAAMAQQLDYVPLPKQLIEQVEQTWRSSIKYGGSAVWDGR